MAAQNPESNTDLFDLYFTIADLNQDGRISGAEAASFFQGANLPKNVLAQIWGGVDRNRNGFLGRAEFYDALKLTTVAQSKRELTPTVIKAALTGPASPKIPAPQINLATTNGFDENSTIDLFDLYFRRADLNQDGRISGAEAASFFQGANLPKNVLAQIWDGVDRNRNGFLSRAEFYDALKLTTVAQSNRELTPNIINAALTGPASLKIPAPQINLAALTGPASLKIPAPQINLAATDDFDKNSITRLLSDLARIKELDVSLKNIQIEKPFNEDMQMDEFEVKNELNELLDQEIEMWKQKATVKQLYGGERNSG
ncbi:Epidermal growth factor receptor substrate 15-like protein [Thalictrum thalictroides]|uniref:Epidermal growth factor receptor substrate 15-like protein n=1 Tax=Thalictrum thalictroides TaxID=46969 RepID=A0A7J6WMN5_THATH|nr:Epidermal growth factor receptor substrate 15-like protein [Thalictrum thalictroides]